MVFHTHEELGTDEIIKCLYTVYEMTKAFPRCSMEDMDSVLDALVQEGIIKPSRFNEAKREALYFDKKDPLAGLTSAIRGFVPSEIQDVEIRIYLTTMFLKHNEFNLRKFFLLEMAKCGGIDTSGVIGIRSRPIWDMIYGHRTLSWGAKDFFSNHLVWF